MKVDQEVAKLLELNAFEAILSIQGDGRVDETETI
jgi:hypothetical protein